MELYLKRRNKVRGLCDRCKRHGEQFDRKLGPSLSQPIRNHTGLHWVANVPKVTCRTELLYCSGVHRRSCVTFLRLVELRAGNTRGAALASAANLSAANWLEVEPTVALNC